MTTSELIMATSSEDATAVDTLRAQHAEILGRLTAIADGLSAAAGAAGQEFDQAFQDGITFIGETVLPHLRIADELLYPAARASAPAKLLVEATLAGTAAIAEQGTRLERATERPRAIAAAESARALVQARFAAEDDFLLPALAASPGVDLAAIVRELGTRTPVAQAPAAAHSHGACGCAESASAEAPELDVRAIPHAIRHATVFGAFDAVPAGSSMILIAHHDPIPLLNQLAERSGGRLEVAYEERGPEAWRLRLTRV
ncbi:DUF2249 domain-containing protein [Tomitella biformata]|uniref:DUF2249 domain-containing protein n=1 Tax=Tomitella biformata TaxID=630403 RepID=UPI000467D367|nr:DUF2249 domain-containing protein [Tomitella biformata]